MEQGVPGFTVKAQALDLHMQLITLGGVELGLLVQLQAAGLVLHDQHVLLDHLTGVVAKHGFQDFFKEWNFISDVGVDPRVHV